MVSIEATERSHDPTADPAGTMAGSAAAGVDPAAEARGRLPVAFSSPALKFFAGLPLMAAGSRVAGGHHEDRVG